MAVVNPVQYGIAPTPVDLGQFARGMAIGGTITDAADVMKQREAAAQKQRMDMAQQAAMRAELAALEQAPSSERARSILLRYPGLKEQVSGFMTSLNEDEKKTRLSQMTEATGFLTSGDVKGAKDAFLRSAQAYENAGRQQDADALKRLAEQVEANPNAVRAQLQLRIEALDPEAGKRLTEFEKSRGDIRKTDAEASIKETQAMLEYDRLGAEIGLAQAQAKRLVDQSAIEAGRLKLDQAELQERVAARLQAARDKEIEISEKQQALMTDAAVNASAKELEAARVGDVAKAFRAQSRNSWETFSNTGLFGKAAETWNTAQGRQGVMTEARLRYSQLVDSDIQRRAKESGNKLTDEDYRQQRALYPDPTGDPELAANWAEQYEKDLRRDAKIDDAKAQWIAKNGGLGPARDSFSIGGTIVGRGETLQDVVKKIGTQSGAAGGKPAPGFATKYEAAPVVIEPTPTSSRRTGRGRGL